MKNRSGDLVELKGKSRDRQPGEKALKSAATRPMKTRFLLLLGLSLATHARRQFCEPARNGSTLRGHDDMPCTSPPFAACQTSSTADALMNPALNVGPRAEALGTPNEFFLKTKRSGERQRTLKSGGLGGHHFHRRTASS